MARPLKRTVDYFPHFVMGGKTLMILQNEFGNDGYSFWFKLLSLLCKTDGQVYDYNNPAAWRLLLAETSVAEDIANKILQLLSEIEAIDPELYLGKIIWVQNLVDNLSDVYTRRRNGSVPERPVIANKNGVIANKKPQTILNQTILNQTIMASSPSASSSTPSKKRATASKQSYGEFRNVLLTLDEFKKLVDLFGDNLPEKIEALSLGIESKGYKYKSHYATLLAWDRRARAESLQSGQKKRVPEAFED